MGGLASLARLMKKNETFRELVAELSKPGVFLSVFSNEAFRAFLIASLYKELNRNFVLITESLDKAEDFRKDISNFVSEEEIFLFPDLDVFPLEDILPSKEKLAQRIKALFALARNKRLLLIVPVQAALSFFLPPDDSVLFPIKIKKGEEVELSNLASKLAQLGYKREPMVSAKGEFSIRGGILDIFPANLNYPVRIEFFGDEVESLRYFSLADQRSFKFLEKVEVYGCADVTLKKENLNKGKTVFDYLTPDTVVVFDELYRVLEDGRRFYEEGISYVEEKAPYCFLKPEQLKSLSFTKLDLASFKTFKDVAKTFTFEALPFENVFNLQKFQEQLKTLLDEGYFTLVVLSREGQLRRVKELFKEWKIAFYDFNEKNLEKERVGFVVGDLGKSWIFPYLKLAVLSETDIFFRRKFREPARVKGALSLPETFDFKRGDFVVHADFGIARYEGLSQEVVEGNIWDVMVLRYADGKLKVRVDQAAKVGRFVGPGISSPKLSYLSKRGRWLRAKNKARYGARKLVIDLLELYAKRLHLEGFAYSPDTTWQKELEDSFPYIETEDQLLAVAEIKKDMETPRPMDRLVLGDVGYGKTEVAIRAAFKAVLDGKQVMVLVPTTILAEQHFATFTQRLAPFPVFIEVLSRFKTPLEQKRILKLFREGKIDILIGTHRLLQKDVIPHDLGLVIVDEEQRFGVAHKEHLRNLKESVDVLTLSATPIPRTLQMSLSGLRDLSIIGTPPEDRWPVLTYVGMYNRKLVRSAIRRELSRGGQVYYLYNRVKTIEKEAEKLQKLVPEAKIAIAHGKMSEETLGKVMTDFLAGKYDVLVCTTIIEAGIDIPNANTIIVTMAEKFGLAQLYQLRGRVGRSDRRAYAYFFFTSPQNLTKEAYERLKTISEFTELGSGYKIALRDLEIRGAGNLLGPEQHGYISQVGFELYLDLIKETAEELKGKLKKKEKEVRIDLPVDAYIPPSYIEDEGLRIAAYKEISSIDSYKRKEEVLSSLKDRYGNLPQPVKNLIDVCELKFLAQEVGVKSIERKDERIFLTLSPEFLEQAGTVLEERNIDYIWRPQYNILVITPPSFRNIISFLKETFSDIMKRASCANKKREAGVKDEKSN